jgi:hypothetical protein
MQLDEMPPEVAGISGGVFVSRCNSKATDLGELFFVCVTFVLFVSLWWSFLMIAHH